MSRPFNATSFTQGLLRWARRNLREFPWREEGRSLYEVFVAEFFMTQTPAQNVAAVYPHFISKFPTLSDIRSASLEEIATAIEPLGLQNRRARALKAIASKWDELPTAMDRLVDLDRVGPYVASATLCLALGQRLATVDRNVRRIYRRLLGKDWPTSVAAQMEFATLMVPRRDPGKFNMALLDFGALVCKKVPLCHRCFASEYCEYFSARGRPGRSATGRPGGQARPRRRETRHDV